MEAPIKTISKKIAGEETESTSDDVVEISLVTSDENDKQDSSSILEIDIEDGDIHEDNNTTKTNKKECGRVDPCLLCGQNAVQFDKDGKQIQREGDHAPLYNYSRLFGFLCKGLSFKPIYGMVKNEWNFNSISPSIPFPFCGRCESLINNLAGVYTRLDALKTELKERMEDGEEVYIKEDLYSKQNVRYFNFRKLVLGVKFQGTVKGRMFQRQSLPSSSGTQRPTCFDESMFPPNHPGSQSQLKTTTTNFPEEGSGSGNSSSSQPPCLPSSPLRKKWKGATSRIPPIASTSQESSSTSSKPTLAFNASRLQRFEQYVTRKRPPLKRNPPNLTPVYIPDTNGFMERCPTSGMITYYSNSSGIGTKMKGRVPNRKILCFNPTPQNDQYQCSECGELVPYLHVRKIQQQQLFRHHYLKFHTDCWKCKMCRDAGVTNKPMDKEELLAHLESQHGITDWNEYLKLSQLHSNNNKSTENEKQQQIL